MPEGTLGPYRLDRELGAGGMGKVWAAEVARRDFGLETGTRVAVKVVHPHLLETPGFFRRFLREAEIGASIRHENVIATYGADAVAAGGVQHHYLVMEYVEGQTLRALLDELERVPEELCRHIGREVAKGLAAIHAAGVVHRDMKPENVLITAGHQVKVMDLGVARLQDEALRLSQTGAFVGSIHYAAPECFREGGKHVDGRADLHALGLVLYELASGVNPYLADDVAQVLRRVLHDEPRRLGDVNPQLSPFFEEVVHTLLAKDPAARFADARALLAVLDDGEKSEWWTSRAQAIREETKRPLRRIRIPRETAVYGRDAELAKLRGLFEKAKSGDGQVVLIEGEAGIGKSRLVDELVGRLQRDGEDLNFLFGSYPPGGAATAAGAFSGAVREHLGDADLAESLRARLGPAAVLAPAFAALLLGTSAPTGAESLTRASIETCFVAVARSLAAERPTVLLIDDLHFAAEEARSLFASLAMAAPGHRMLLVGTTRPGIDERWLAGLTRLPQTCQVAVGRLGPKDLALLLADSFQSAELARELGVQIAMKSDGNPFFAFEIVRGLREGQFIRRTDDGTWVTTRIIEEIRIPSSVLDLVNARVADLSQEERDLLDVASCCGFEFDPALVAAATGVALLPALRQFAAIEKRHRLVRAAGRRLAFDHHQVQEALYGSLYEQMREAYHAAIAEAMEARAGAGAKEPGDLDGALCVDLCEHLFRGAAGARALRYLDAAQTHLSKGSLHAQVVALGEKALAVPELLAAKARAEVLVRLTRALDLLGRRSRHEECAREAVRLADLSGDDELRGRAAQALGVVLEHTSRFAEAGEEYDRALGIAKARGDRAAEGRAEVALGTNLWAQSRLPEARSHLERGIALHREDGDRTGEAGATVNLGLILHAEGRLAEAREHQERGVRLCREIGHRRFEANAMSNLGGVLVGQGLLAEAHELLERALAIHREIGDRSGAASTMGSLGLVLYRQGRLAEAREQQIRAQVIHHEIGNRGGEINALGNLGVVALDEGRLADAREAVLRVMAMSREAGFQHGEAHSVANLAFILAAEGRVREAQEHMVRALALHRGIGDRHSEAMDLEFLGELAGEEGDTAAAREWLDAASALAKDVGLPGIETHARCELARLPGGDPRDALAAFAEHEPRLAASERLAARYQLWRATGDRTHLTEAKQLLDAALAANSPESRKTMVQGVRIHRAIVAACQAEGIA